MNDPRDGKQPDDAALDEWLAGESPLSRRYAELGDEQPPAELDRKILASAAEASKVVPLERTTRRWGASIAVAATVLLCVSIVVNLSIQPDGPLLDEAPPQVEFADKSEVTRESAYSEDARDGAGRFDELRRRSQPAMAPPSVIEEVNIEPPPGESLAADEPAMSGRVSLGAGIDSAAVRPSLEMSPAAEPGQDEAQLARAIELLQARAATGETEPSAPASVQRKADAAPDPGDRLDAVLAAWEADEPDLAWTRLQAFLRDYPEHPFSRELIELD
jgi:hypothetical protein